MFDKIVDNLPAIVTALASLAVVRVYMKKILTLMEEVRDVENTIAKALEDGVLSKEEMEGIIKEAREVPSAFKEVVDPIKNFFKKILRR